MLTVVDYHVNAVALESDYDWDANFDPHSECAAISSGGSAGTDALTTAVPVIENGVTGTSKPSFYIIHRGVFHKTFFQYVKFCQCHG